jgi:membrane fusion protein (multidrug efflux system)
MPVHVTIPAGGKNLSVDGKLSFVDPAVSTDTRSVLLRAVVPNSRHRLHPGLYVRVSLNLTEHPDALVVPAAAVTNDLGGAYVYIVDDGDIARRRRVATGLSNGREVELVSGVKLGERIVTVGQFRLQDGDPVTVEPAEPEAEDAS